MIKLSKCPLNKVPSLGNKFLEKNELCQFNSINMKCNIMALEVGHLLGLWPIMKEASNYPNSSLVVEFVKKKGNEHLLIPYYATRHMLGTT